MEALARFYGDSNPRTFSVPLLLDVYLPVLLPGSLLSSVIGVRMSKNTVNITFKLTASRQQIRRSESKRKWPRQIMLKLGYTNPIKLRDINMRSKDSYCPECLTPSLKNFYSGMRIYWDKGGYINRNRVTPRVETEGVRKGLCLCANRWKKLNKYRS